MSRLAVEQLATGPVTLLDASYNSSKWNLGDLIKQRLDFNPPFIGPIINSVARPAEMGTALANLGMYPWAMQWDVSNGIDWVFLADQTAAGATRKIQLYEFNRNKNTGGPSESAFTWKGFVTLQPPTGIATTGVHTIAGFRMSYEPYSKGQVTSGTGGAANVIHGWQESANSSTAWINDGLCVGNRIGFGSKDPTQIAPSNWYTIAFIQQNSSIFLTNPLSSPLSVSTNYVIEDLRAIIYTIGSTTLTNGGLNIAKGLSYFDFVAGGTTCVSCNVLVDSSRYVYRLVPINGLTPINSLDVSAAGIAIEPKTDWKTQYLYGINLGGATAGTPIKVFKYNIRAPLTILPGLGASVSAISVSTGYGNATAATISRLNNGRFAKLGHGINQDVSAIYFTTLTKVNSIRTADVINNSTTFVTYEMQEKPPGTTSLFAATGALTGLEVASSMDRLLVMTSGAAGIHSYVSKFYTNAETMDHIFLADDKQIDQSLANPDNTSVTPHISTLSVYQAPWVENGILYTAGTGTTALLNIMHSAAIGVDWAYSSSTNTVGRLISPKFRTPNCNNFVRAYAVRDNYLGNDLVGKRTDALRLSYRTSGIDDNSGPWTVMSEPNSLSGAGSSEEIQLMVEFKGITEFCVPARVMVLGVVYDDMATDSHFRLSQVNSNVTTKAFAWRFVTAFDSSVPALKIHLLNDVGNGELLTDYTDTSTAGYWEKSYNDGTNWVGYNSADKGNETTYIRYTPLALADNTKVRAVLTQR
jgi:hypothetical protein